MDSGVVTLQVQVDERSFREAQRCLAELHPPTPRRRGAGGDGTCRDRDHGAGCVKAQGLAASVSGAEEGSGRVIPVNIQNTLKRDGVVKVIIGAEQPEYVPLPALVFPLTDECLVLTEWEFTAQELATLMDGGRLRLLTYTFGHPFQPVVLQVVGPDEMLPLETVS